MMPMQSGSCVHRYWGRRCMESEPFTSIQVNQAMALAGGRAKEQDAALLFIS